MANLFPRLLNSFSKLSLANLQNINKYALCRNAAVKSYSSNPTPYEIVDEDKDYKLVETTVAKVNEQIAQNKQGRLFAIVQIAGKHRKITEGDVVIVEGYWPPDCGEKILLNKVLLAGAVDFTLIGRPLVQKGLVTVEATVIEKTLSHTKTHFRKKRRKQYMRINFYKIPQTFLRINTIRIGGEVNNPPDVRGLENVIL